VTDGKGSSVKPRAYPQTPGDSAQKHSTSCRTHRGSSGSVALGALESRLMECLDEADEGLTVKQLEARVPDVAGKVEEALEVLVKMRLLARLNTIIPRYVVRTSSDKGHTG
jgi:hypothetical protein